MGEIVPLVLEEQQLCEEFFHLHIQDESKRSGGGDGSGESDKGGDGGGEGGGDDGGGDDEVREKQQQHQHLEVQTPLRTPRRATTHTPRPRERKQPSRLSTVSHQPQIHPLLHDLLNVMFNGLDDAIHTMMQAGYKQDALCVVALFCICRVVLSNVLRWSFVELVPATMHVVVPLAHIYVVALCIHVCLVGSHVCTMHSNSTVALVVLSGLSQQVASESTFLFQLFGKCYVYAKRLYDSYIDSVVDAVMTAQVKKKDGCGILPFVSSFSRLVRDSEAVGAKEECHSLLDKAYLRLLGAIFDRVQEIAADAKEPDVILFENFHNLYDQLSRLKIDSLKQYRADAQEKYRTHITRFVQSVLGRPMERLSSFFEGVEQLIRQGTAPQDVGYYSEFNKQQLRAIIKLYPGKEVKKGLESTYKRVQKQLCTEENLLVVVWRSIQEEFVRLHAHFEELIAKCYPNSNIRLEFEVEDLLQYFASIAERS
ncbi:hypothetical protein PTSG_00034 [Salpingoeca rosetta]|uniref:Exocyst complex component Sec3 C-terminal domain-containing protein n=1 Tax=Salpingoeca rosetta (strain ATCC 50818 / BSB-021) TaxID=946362 RepID=F2TVC2_SALR5|nr:uncharacterized protein PTSG_00034 [Salpingoeca rosetta]EGD72018.1 hypothetical protein PTSG_00034 [Salpingoeca rosetta]|eukprot:XP_004998590.1 hypothetical protein PTSG_00034 [Salpingoeca rosetta]